MIKISMLSLTPKGLPGQIPREDLYLGLQCHAGLRLYGLPDTADQGQNVGAGGPAGVDDEARVLLRYLGAADPGPLQAALLNQAPGEVAGGALEGAPGAGPVQRLLLPAAADQKVSFFPDTMIIVAKLAVLFLLLVSSA